MIQREALLRDMARCPDLFGTLLCRQMESEAAVLRAKRIAAG